jgi:hypothetical protein
VFGVEGGFGKRHAGGVPCVARAQARRSLDGRARVPSTSIRSAGSTAIAPTYGGARGGYPGHMTVASALSPVRVGTARCVGRTLLRRQLRTATMIAPGAAR